MVRSQAGEAISRRLTVVLMYICAPQVLLPVEPNSEVPDFIFERTGLELKRMWQAARRQREQEQVPHIPPHPISSLLLYQCHTGH